MPRGEGQGRERERERGDGGFRTGWGLVVGVSCRKCAVGMNVVCMIRVRERSLTKKSRLEVNHRSRETREGERERVVHLVGSVRFHICVVFRFVFFLQNAFIYIARRASVL